MASLPGVFFLPKPKQEISLCRIHSPPPHNRSLIAVAVLSILAGAPEVRAVGTTTRVSVASDGTKFDYFYPAISADGRYIAFSSNAKNLVPRDTNNTADIFVYDINTEETTRVSIASDGTQWNSYSESPSISADGRYVAFTSGASNLIPGEINEGGLFVHDRQTKQTTRIGDGAQSSISADGRYVAFWVKTFDTELNASIFVHDRQTSQTTLVSINSDGMEADDYSYFPSISADGRYVGFASRAHNLVPENTNGFSNVFVHDRRSKQTTLVNIALDGSGGDGFGSSSPSISADGRYVAFFSSSNNLVEGDTNAVFVSDVFVRDRLTKQTTRVNVASDGTQSNGSSGGPVISADGRYVTFSSSANNLSSRGYQ